MADALKTIQQVADLAHVTTAALRYYDEIGLLKPRARSDAGYRLYGREELLRLREILIWRELRFPLADIQRLIDEPDHDRHEALERQFDLVGEQVDRFAGIARDLETALSVLAAGPSLREEEVFADFGADAFSGEGWADDLSPIDRIGSFTAQRARRSQSRTTDPAAHGRPQRVIATDPVRIGEDLLALGVFPVGAGTFSSGGDGQFWPWPESVEPIVRGRIQPLGWSGVPQLVGTGDRFLGLEPSVQAISRS